MNKVISPNLKMGLLNAGLLSGTGDTIGRTLGNCGYTLITVVLLSTYEYLFVWYIIATVVVIVF